jgi:hypothetical protein
LLSLLLPAKMNADEDDSTMGASIVAFSNAGD